MYHLEMPFIIVSTRKECILYKTDIIQEITRVLEQNNIDYEHRERYLLLCVRTVDTVASGISLSLSLSLSLTLCLCLFLSPLRLSLTVSFSFFFSLPLSISPSLTPCVFLCLFLLSLYLSVDLHFSMFLTKITAAQNEVALSYHIYYILWQLFLRRLYYCVEIETLIFVFSCISRTHLNLH